MKSPLIKRDLNIKNSLKDRREKILTRAALRISKALSDVYFGYEELHMIHGKDIESLDLDSQEYEKLFEQYMGMHIKRYVDAFFDAAQELSLLEKDDE